MLDQYRAKPFEQVEDILCDILDEAKRSVTIKVRVPYGMVGEDGFDDWTYASWVQKKKMHIGPRVFGAGVVFTFYFEVE